MVTEAGCPQSGVQDVLVQPADEESRTWWLAGLGIGSLYFKPLHLLLVLLNSILDSGIHHGLREDPILRGICHGLVGKRAQKERLAACTGKLKVVDLDPEALGTSTVAHLHLLVDS